MPPITKIPKIMSRKRRKLLYIRLKNRCHRLTPRYGIPWHTDQKRFQLGSATIRLPSHYKQQCFTIIIVTQAFEDQHALRKLNRALKSITEVPLENLEKRVKRLEGDDNNRCSVVNLKEVTITKVGLTARITTGEDNITETLIEEIIDEYYAALCEEIKLVKFNNGH